MDTAIAGTIVGSDQARVACHVSGRGRHIKQRSRNESRAGDPEIAILACYTYPYRESAICLGAAPVGTNSKIAGKRS
jgi:hypothetical protein